MGQFDYVTALRGLVESGEYPEETSIQAGIKAYAEACKIPVELVAEIVRSAGVDFKSNVRVYVGDTGNSHELGNPKMVSTAWDIFRQGSGYEHRSKVDDAYAYKLTKTAGYGAFMLRRPGHWAYLFIISSWSMVGTSGASPYDYGHTTGLSQSQQQRRDQRADAGYSNWNDK